MNSRQKPQNSGFLGSSLSRAFPGSSCRITSLELVGPLSYHSAQCLGFSASHPCYDDISFTHLYKNLPLAWDLLSLHPFTFLMLQVSSLLLSSMLFCLFTILMLHSFLLCTHPPTHICGSFPHALILFLGGGQYCPVSVTLCNTVCDSVTTSISVTLPICGLHNTLRKMLEVWNYIKMVLE